MKMIETVCAGLVLSAFVPVSAGALTEQDFQKIAAEVFQPAIDNYAIPGLVAGVTVDGKHFVYTYGVASRQSGAAVTADTIFELGSVSKIFNVTLAALAQERGLLSMDQPVSDYFPRLKGSAFDRITLIHLATHATGGLPLQVPDEIENEEDLFNYLSAFRPDADPDTMRSYSNVSIGLLGLIVASAMDIPYARAVEDTLFPMLGLESSYVDVPPDAESRYAYGYSRDGDQPIRVNPGMLDAEAYGVKSTVNDLLRFLDVSLGVVAVPAELEAAIQKTHTGYFETAFYTQDMIWEQYPWPTDLDRLVDGNSSEMALEGQPVKRWDEPVAPQRDVFLNKTGSTNGFGAYVVLLPGEDLGVVVLANRNYPNTERAKLVHRLIEQLNQASPD